MITLYGFKPAFGLPDPSPFVSKVEILLKMAGLPYERKSALPGKGPKGKIPWIVDDGEAIGDSTMIRWHIEKKYGVDFDAGYSASERAQAWAFEKMLEEHAYWAAVSNRWNVPANFDKGPRTFFKSVPALIRPMVISMVAKRFNKNLYAQGMGRHAQADIDRLGVTDLIALSDFMDDKLFLLGDRPCGADATAYSFVLGALCPLFDSPMRDAAASRANLVAYAERCTKKFYSDGIPGA